MGKRGTALVLGAVALAMAAPSAQGATISKEITSGVSGGDSYTNYVAAPGESNQIKVTMRGLRVTIVDRGAHGIRARSGCKRLSRVKATCKGDLARFAISAGDGNDRVDLRGHAKRNVCGGSRVATAEKMKSLMTVEPDEEGEDPFIGFPSSATYVDLGAGDDWVQTSCSGETIADGPGSDTVQGNGSHDEVITAPDGSDDRFELGGLTDGISYARTTTPVTVDLAAGTAGPTGGTERDVVSGVEVVLGGSGADQITGTGELEGFVGGPGDDHIDTGPGPDYVACQAGNDTVLPDPADLRDGCA